ncbi:hypothetical protein [Silvibacterium dinghuense]|uniref:Uncharacterized protein n=1 Tax=Silvibacterium dinghuense TaxID=1560006 RepID=A0A4Q1SGQ5_9BACT|nr:hypothetical protein [Silvibacterium dinghuense]RXS96535.1 hypothetical protein ESZ00_00840 [Silvibacterium dinghuense]GGG91592.1 hypothetical protein GCM10011586_02750 [Silvibacterium dinghuense]
MQGDVDENVDYDPIFAAGRGWLASLIAVAGVLFGNGGLYLISRLGLKQAETRKHQAAGLFWLLVCLMCVGNFIAYVPNRTFAAHADMATTERGLGCSPWWIAIGLGVPFLIASWHYFARILPRVAVAWSRELPLAPLILAVIAVLIFTEFYGRAGLQRYGPVSHGIAAFWSYAVPVPLLWLTIRRVRQEISARPI